MSGVTVLLYNLENDKGRRIEKFCRSMALKPEYVDKADYHMVLERLLERNEDGVWDKGNESVNTADVFEEEMMVMCGFNGRLLDIFLKEYKKRHIEPVSLKAMLTEHNRKWTSVELYKELCRERNAFTNR